MQLEYSQQQLRVRDKVKQGICRTGAWGGDTGRADTAYHSCPSCEHFTYIGKVSGSCSCSPVDQMRKLTLKEGKELTQDHTARGMPHHPWHKSLRPTGVQHSVIPSPGRIILHFLLTPSILRPPFLHSLEQTGKHFMGEVGRKKKASSLIPRRKNQY